MLPTQPLIINNWQQGIADSEFLGFGNMKMVDIELFPGSVKCQKKGVALFATALSSSFTADASSDTCTLTGGGSIQATGIAVTLSTTGSLPSGLSTSTVYYLIQVSSSTFKLATTLANAMSGTQIDITSAGSGTHTVTTVNPGTIRHIVKDDRTTTYFMQDSNGRVWMTGYSYMALLTGNTLSGVAGNGLVIFATTNTLAASAVYLLAFRNAAIDIINVYGTSNKETPVWSNSWQSLNSGAGTGNSHHAIIGQDLICYFCDGQYVGSLKENIGSTFDPATGASYTYNNQALDVPAQEICQWLEELGINLLIGGKNTNYIYPWDRVSNSYNIPLAVPEKQILKMKNIGGVVYILAGTNGNIYSTQGSYVNLFKRLPGNLMNASATIQSNPVTWGSIAARNGALLVGASGLTTGNKGLFLIYPDGRLVMDNIPTTGSANVTAIYVESPDFYYFGYSGGADQISDSSSRYNDFTSLIQSKLFVVSDKITKGSYSTLEVQLAKPTSGQVRVGYRTDTSSAFTTIDTYTLDSVATSFMTQDIGLIDIENIQIQVELSGSVELLEVRLFP
jgi:hypothetical protein